MRKVLGKVGLGGLVVWLILVASVSVWAAAVGDSTLQADCLAATIKAIKQEIQRHQQWLEVRKEQGDEQGAAAMEEALARLKADLDRYQAMDAKDYILPAPKTTVAWVGEELKEDPILTVEGMTKSGPWYHVVGIAGGDYGLLKPIAKYNVKYYEVYPRSYWHMTSAYIFIAAVERADAPPAAKHIKGEVFATYYSGLSSKLIKCENYKVYLLPSDAPGERGELILDAKRSEFDLTISADKIKQYPYLEFVGQYGSKMIDLRTIKDGEWLDVYLVPQVVVKKPVIYLYPTKTMLVEVKHEFKGRLHTTYPEYNDGWRVIASPDGDLLNTRDNRHYQYIFWDGSYDFPLQHYRLTDGFVVKKENYAAFLRDKLQQIGLNEREINDFIVYWLPEMNKYQNCFVHFRINDNIDGSSVLAVKPKPQTMIRVFMEYYGFDAWDDRPRLPEQVLPSIPRQGFTLVEWGGSRLAFLLPVTAEPAKEDYTYLGEDQGIKFYGFPQMANRQEWAVRLELGQQAKERLMGARPAGGDADIDDKLANIASAICWARVDAIHGVKVIEQCWLDETGKIVGRSGGSPQADAWPASWLANACERFLLRWLTFGYAGAQPSQETADPSAGGIGKWLWGLNWTTNQTDAEQILGKQGFVLRGKGEEPAGGTWLKMDNGLFLDLPCELKLVWRGDGLAAVDVTVMGGTAMLTDITYRHLLASFTADYGSPTKTAAYELKIWPPILVETATWLVKPDNGPIFTITVSQQRRTFTFEAGGDVPGKLGISFKRLVNSGANIDD
ncbi:hypothetical protein [Thermosinus carboxydivorans]|uniref:hypothetical protein n=1 Tax=Thermosinus carboxydivorans TaxID=261685 RepID=UPI0002F3F3B5|nr:hypothetical protein [Thermosinus carboxydivorans]